MKQMRKGRRSLFIENVKRCFRRWLPCLLAGLLLCPLLRFSAAGAEEPVSFFDDVERDSVGVVCRTYDSPTLKYTVERFVMHGEKCFLTRIWVQDPARQIRKSTGEWKKKLKFPRTMAAEIPGAAVVINGSGYVSPRYPEIPENYPGESKDYFYTPLGSLTVTDGEVFRNLEGVPYYGITLEEDGLRMYTGADNEEVLAAGPVQTWSFYTDCPMLRNNEDLLPADWAFADRRAERTIIGRLDRNNYLILSVGSARKGGISLRRAVIFFQENFAAEWVYNLDGGPSSALLVRKPGAKRMETLLGGNAKDADIMAFTE